MAQKKAPDTSKKIKDLVQELGKVPPQAVDLEEAVIGAIMLEKDAIVSVIDIITAACFYKDTHKIIFEAILELSKKLQPIDLLTVTEELRKNEKLDQIGGPYFLTQLTNKVASAAHIEFHARIITQKYIQRELIRISSEVQEKAFDNTIDVDDLIDFAEGQLFDVAMGNIKKETQKIDAVIDQALKRIEELSGREEGFSGVPSGFIRLDRITSGWQPSDLIIIAARPSMGKTAFVLTMMRNMAVDHEKAVAIFSLEMSSIQLVNRMIVSETELPSEKIRNGNLKKYEWEQLEIKLKHLVDAPILIDDTPAISVFELRAKARRLKIQYDIQLLIVDYLQLMSGPTDSSGNREQEVSTISRSLKAIAKELDIPIIALSQLNRSVELRSGDKRPQLSDLRESGAIEQDADLVLFIHRPERFGLLQDAEGNSTKGMAEIIIAKHRNGSVGDVQLKFKDELAKFTDLDEEFIAGFDGVDSGSLTMGSKMNDGDQLKPAEDLLSPNRDFEDAF
ncbi:MAG: replicative DNA helicase [Bacteroidetes bacterium]|jgi:replicative DNA helicase|nr:replicative DNA helicase [Bacteroidota bacterium]MBT4400106.1 replicative DNA helicase [Bacteroidota bacterium]MBT4411415.1 replicative DNA helicase [Bacteroidota bacterium]MBT5425952.1 replicative DNA helicase [Bacteroidota bacterium]MBT7095410.1 replicative DNA helicase [Bacteroidota bacterium]